MLYDITLLEANINPTFHSLFAISSKKVKVGFSLFMIIMAVTQPSF